MSDGDEELKARLLASFCPVLRFDAAEKHYPISAETFISSSLLLRRPKRQARVQREGTEQQAGPIKQPEDATDDEAEDEEGDEGLEVAVGSAGAGAGAGDGASTCQTHEDEMRRSHGQACGECGQKQGWMLPTKGGWTLVRLPRGAQSWSTAALLEEQGRDNLHEFRLEPHSCVWEGQTGDLSTVPCYAYADLLDPSAIAPFIRRAGMGPVYELKYAFLYGYNGTTFAIPGTSVGVHTGDLEHVTVRVDATRMMLLETFFAAHSTGEGKWVPSKEFYRQVEAWEAAAYPGVAEEAPVTIREFLEMRSPASPPMDSGSDGEAVSAGRGVGGGGAQGDGSGDGRGGGADDGGGERLVVFPARNGHASYHAPRRWRRFVGLGDDICGGDGKTWQPPVVQLDHPGGNTPPWLQFRGWFGGTRCIPWEGFWKHRGEPPRRCSAEGKYRSLLEEGLVPDRGVRLGPSRRMLHGNPDRGVWLARHRQTETRVPIFNTWTGVPGLSSGRPRNEDPPRQARGRVWLADWGFLQDIGGGSTDAKGWSYHSSQAEYADTGIAGAPKKGSLMGHRSRGRVWFRVAASPEVAREVEEAHRRDSGRHPRRAIALAALDVAGRGEAVTSVSLLETLRVGGHRVGSPGTASRDGGGGGGVGRVLLSAPSEPSSGKRGVDESLTTFGSVAARSLGECLK
ncbi:unnamed protein product [Scytosiphon promiscuus]